MWNGHQAWFDKKSEKIKSVGDAKKKSMTLNEKRKYLADKWNKNWSLVDKKALRAWQFSSQKYDLQQNCLFSKHFLAPTAMLMITLLASCVFCVTISPSLSFHNSLSLSSLIPSLPFASDSERYLMWEPTKSFGAFAQKKENWRNKSISPKWNKQMHQFCDL